MTKKKRYEPRSLPKPEEIEAPRAAPEVAPEAEEALVIVAPPPVAAPSEVELSSLKVGEWFMFRGVKYRRGTSEEDFVIVINPSSPTPRSVLGLNTIVKPIK